MVKVKDTWGGTKQSRHRRSRELEGTAIATTEKANKSFSQLWDSKPPNISVTGAPKGGKRREEGNRNHTGRNSWMKTTNPHIREAQQLPSTRTLKNVTLMSLIIKLLITSDKENT